MKIRKMSATFGKLKNAKMELSDGLNVICAPNEYGKSTWCAFIKAMLYGIDTSERDKAGYIADKTRYRPWDGGAMEGTMDVLWDGREITLSRTALGSSPMKKFLAAKKGTADFLSELNGENAGELLTGVPERVFERTAFIRRPGLRIAQTPELEKRISLLVASGDEDVSYSDTDAALRKMLRELRYNKHGSLPRLEEKLREQQDKLLDIERSGEGVAELRDRVSRFEKQVELLENDLVTHDKLDSRAEARRLSQARAKAKTARAEADGIKAQLTRNGRLVTRDDVNVFREAVSAITPLREVRENAEKSAFIANKELENARSRMKLSPLGALTVEDAAALAAKARDLEAGNTDVRKPVIPPVAAIIIAILGVITATLGFIAPVQAAIAGFLPISAFAAGIAVKAVGGVIAAAGIFFLIYRPKSLSDAAAELKTILDKYGVETAGRLEELSQQYTALYHETETASAAAAGAEANRKNAVKMTEDAEKAAKEKVADIMPNAVTGEQMAAEIIKLDELLDKLTKAEFDAVAAQNIFETLLSGFSGDPDAPEEYIPMPIRNREDTQAALERARVQMAEAEREYNVALGRQKSLGDPAVIESEMADIKEELSAGMARYDALSIAIDTLGEANTELQTRFSPILSHRAGEILKELTKGRYERLFFNKSFDADAKTSDDVVARSALMLSEGTADEVYFSLRLAMCELMLSGNESCPVILDDALANFDDIRCADALRFLEKESEKRQIILFTCRKRESEMVRGTSANVIEA